jgi:tetratricopeptide (TPR) repeat protein
VNDLDSIHQKASQHYLQGDVSAALRAWKHLLELAPSDERAAEGVRLCETMLDAQQGAAPKTATAADPGEPAAESDGFAELDLKLNLDSGHEIDSKPQESDGPAAEGRGIDFDWALEEEASEVETPVEDSAAGRPAAQGWEWDSGEDNGDEAAPALPVEAQESTAALELRRRANELLANALVAMEAGHHDEALRTLDRVLILDEENEAARSLKVKIAEARTAEPDEIEEEASGPVEFDMELGDGPSLGLGGADEPVSGEQMEANADADVVAPLPVAGPPREDDLAADPEMGDLSPGEALTAEYDEGDDFLEEEGTEADPSRSNRRRMAVAAAALVAGAGAAFYFFGGFGGERSKVVKIDPVKEAAAAAAAVDEALAPLPDTAPPPGGDDATVVAPVEGISTLLEEANAAVDSGNFAAAVVSFNRVLELDPTNAAAAAGLTSAGESYREQRERDEQWRKARQAFADGSYRDALRMFYRLPATENPELVARYKLNGWYNVGLRALKSNDCETARSSFKDAREVQGSNDGLAEVARLARTCTRDPEYYRIVSSLQYRALDD